MSLRKAAFACGVVLAAATGLGAGSALAASHDIEIVLPEQPAKLDPCQSIRADIGRIINYNTNEALTYVDPDTGKPQPLLATEWKQESPTTWRFTLHDGVKFQDGEPFNAEAVVYSIKRLMNPNLACDSRSKLGVEKLSAKAIDPTTVEITADRPVPILPTLLGMVMMVSPNTPMDKATNEPIGTGPYKLESISQQKIVLDRFKDYWGPKPAVEKATFVWRGDSAIRAAMVKTGEADMTPMIAVQDATDPKLDDAYLNSETTRMRIDDQIAPLNDVRVRKALNLSIDWNALKQLFGNKVLRASQMVVPGINGFNPDIKPWPYDAEKAKQLLDAARADGVPVDTEINIIGRTGFFPNGDESLQAMMAMWEAVGFKMKLTMLDAANWVRYLDKPFPPDRGPTLLQQSHDNNMGDAVFTVYTMYDSEGQYSTVKNPEIDKLIEKAGAATGKVRTETYQEVFKKIHDDVVADVPMFHMVGYTRIGPKIDWKPSLATNGQIRISEIKFKDE